MKGRHYRWDTGLRVRVLGLLVFLVTLLVGLGAAFSYTFAHVDAVQHQAERTRQNVLVMEQVTGTFSEMTSSLRGFLLTGDESFLRPYDKGRVSLEFALNKLILTANGDQLARIHDAGELIRNWEAQVAEPEIAAKRAHSPAAGDLVARGSGPSYIDQVRLTADAYIQAESDRLDKEASSASAAARDLQRGTWLGVGLAAFMALAGFLVVARGVTRATDALASAAEAIARGERGVVVNATLDGELQEVADAFSAMSMTLGAQEEELQAQQEELIAQNEELLAQQDELQAKAERLEQQDRRLSRLNRMGQALIGTIEIDQLSHLILDEYLDLFGGSAGVLLVTDPFSDQMIVQAERWLSPRWRGARLTPSGPLARCVSNGQVVTAHYPESLMKVEAWQSEFPVAQETYIPLVHTTRVIAVVIVAAMEPNQPSDEAMGLYSSIARQASVALAAALNHLEVKRGLQVLQEQAAQVEELNAQLEEERDRAAAQLDIYLSIVSTMPAGAWLTDTGGNPLVVNATFREFFGEVPDGEDLQCVLEQMQKQLPKHDPFLETVRSLIASRDGSGEGRIRLTNGYVLQWSSAPVGKAHDLVGRLFTFQDVTELAKLDQLKSEFVNTVSHELRTPLTSIMGYLSLVLNGQVGPLGDQQRDFLGVVMRNTDRLSTLINDLLDVQRIESGRTPLNKRPVQLAEIVRHVAETFQVAAAQKGLAFEVSIPLEELPNIEADPDRLTQIASNLVSNAVKYTREGRIKVTVAKGQDTVNVVVEDTGIGIPQAEQKRIFEKFYRGENRYAREAGGTGLGLSIVKMMVEEHGGEVRVESHPGKGSRFTVTLPAQTPA
ncbi:MAG TPA: ATP-binding protein [Symbiobacteriaceae bacterium]|jgi:signal transduction histidine kinase/CHASE3 domain sensor protein